MFRRVCNSASVVSFTFEGKRIEAEVGDTIAAALLHAGVTVFRTSVISGEPRAPYCMMGVCFECLLTIDGVANRQSCLTEVAEGMIVRLQNGPRDV